MSPGPSPLSPGEQHGDHGQHWIDLYAAEEHVHRIEDLRGIGHAVVTAHRAELLESGAYIGQRTDGCSEGAVGIDTVQQAQEDRQRQQDGEERHIEQLGHQVFLADSALAYAYAADFGRMKGQAYLACDGLDQHHESVGLDAAGSRPGHTSDDPDEQGDDTG